MDFIPPCVCQEADVCWSVAYIHQFEATLRINGKLGVDEHLSIQELINVLPRRHREKNGTIHGSKYAIAPLTTLGTVLESVCPLTYDLNHQGRTPEHPDVKRFVLKVMEPHYLRDYINADPEFGSDYFEYQITEMAAVAPVSVRIRHCEVSHSIAGAGGIYDPTWEELQTAEHFGYGHFLLLIRPVTIDGVHCWECQDSFGPEWGNGGRVYIRRHCDLVTEVIYMEV